MRKRPFIAGLGWMTAVMLAYTGTAAGATYQFQVASVAEHVFMFFVRDGTLPDMEAYLDDTQRSKFVLFHDRPPELIEPIPGDALAPALVNVRMSKRNDPWGASTWEGETGQLAVFRIRGNPNNHQKLRRVAVHTNHVLSRFPVRGIPASGSRRLQIPEAPASFLAHALQSGTFAVWAEKHAETYGGLSVIVGRDHSGQQSDTVYVLVRMPQWGRSYKVVLGWQDMNHRGVNGNGQGNQS